MNVFTRCKVLIPERILEQQKSLSEQNFLALVRKYLVHYTNYRLIGVENGFAICDREDEKERNKKRKQKKPNVNGIGQKEK